MLSLAIAIAISASIIRADSTLKESRLKPQYFTRNRKLPFQKLLKYLLSMHKASSQAALNNFLEREGITMSQQALSKARSKFDHTPFLKLFTAVRDAFYGTEYIDTLRKYNNKFLIAIDGSDTSLPNLPSLLEKFGGTGSFKELYFKRWRIEVEYDVVKNKLELPCFGGFSENVIMQDFWITMYLANMVAIIKNEADQEIAEERKDKDNKYEYQANVNTLIGSMRDRLADAVFSRNPAHRQKKLERILLEVKKSVVPIRPDDGNTPRYENTRKSLHHHNKRHNL